MPWLLRLVSLMNLFVALATGYGLHIEVIDEKNLLSLTLWKVHSLIFLV